MESIKLLPVDTINSVRTSFIIASFGQAVEEVVLNSIDAKATSIEVNLDVNNWSFSVLDNGTGIHYSDLKTIGERYGNLKIVKTDFKLF
jgi:DNA mismatch repair ATPase MutL